MLPWKNIIHQFKMNEPSNYIKYGTDKERHIWMLRYGMSFEDIDILDRHIEKIDEEQIVFKPSINNIPEEDRAVVNRFM